MVQSAEVFGASECIQRQGVITFSVERDNLNEEFIRIDAVHVSFKLKLQRITGWAQRNWTWRWSEIWIRSRGSCLPSGHAELGTPHNT